jgi:hypothetical protein
MWAIALTLCGFFLALSAVVPDSDTASTGALAGAVIGFVGLFIVLVALKGSDAWTLYGLMLVLGWVFRAFDLTSVAWGALYVLVVAAGAYLFFDSPMARQNEDQARTVRRPDPPAS